MSFAGKVKRVLSNWMSFQKKGIAPASAYDLWASTYDEQTNNLIVYLDEIIFTQLIDNIALKGKTVVDIGCGTGNHWGKILSKHAYELIGYEVSEKMLAKLHEKYPKAKTYLSQDNHLNGLQDNSCDLIISTLVIGYIKNLSKIFTEWSRVLKKDGDILITDFHPVAVQKGASRSFKHEGQTVFIKNYLHTLDEIRTLAKEMKWKEVRLIERKVDESVKFFYEKLNVLRIYKDSYNTPLIYGIHFRKS
jgi:ubiquinone/menaquinone biosynthesis C-methylase UbiE